MGQPGEPLYSILRVTLTAILNTFQGVNINALGFKLDSDSKLGTYFRINPSFASYVPSPQITMEFERELTTSFRTGSHSLAVETGRQAPCSAPLCPAGYFRFKNALMQKISGNVSDR